MSIMFIMVIGLSIALILLSYLLNHRTTLYKVKGWGKFDELESKSQYECGLELFEESLGQESERFFLKFYIIGIIFLIFDLESILLFPASILLGSFSSDLFQVFITLLLFLYFVVLGLIFEFKQNIL